MPFNSGASVSLIGYWGRDVLDINLVEEVGASDPTGAPRDRVDFLFNWGNRLAGLTWRQPLGGSMLTTRASITDFSTTFGLVPDLARWDNHVRLVSGSSDLSTTVLRDHRLHVGASVERYDMTYDVQEAEFVFGDDPGNLGGLIPVFNRDYRPTVLALYADDEWGVSARLKLRPGVRVEHIPGGDLHRRRATRVVQMVSVSRPGDKGIGGSVLPGDSVAARSGTALYGVRVLGGRRRVHSGQSFGSRRVGLRAVAGQWVADDPRGIP